MLVRKKVAKGALQMTQQDSKNDRVLLIREILVCMACLGPLLFPLFINVILVRVTFNCT